MRRLLLAKAIVLSLLLTAAARPAAKETWTSIRSKNFIVVGNASEGGMRKVVTRLEQFRQVLSILFPKVRMEASAPTTVIIFKDHDSFRPYKPRYKGKPQDGIGGYFVTGPDANYIALTNETRGVSPYEIIFHEYEHFVLRNNMRNAPLWLNEGLAEFYSTFETLDDDQKIKLGQPIGRHIVALRENRLLPLQTLLTVDHKSPHYNEGGKAGIFYAQSWALIHYLMIGNDSKRQPQLTRFINQLSPDLPLEENFRQSFQADFKTIEKELDQYIRRFTFPVLIGTLKKELEFAKETHTSALSEAEVQYYQGELLARTGQLEEAEGRLQNSIKLDAAFSPSRVSLAVVFLRQGRVGEAGELLRAAIASDPKNHLAHYYYAEVLRLRREFEEALKSYQQAALLRPDSARTYADLGYTYLRLGREEEALQAFGQAARLDPVGGAHLHRSRGYLYLRLARGGPAAADALTYLKRQGWRDDQAPYMALLAHFGYRQAQQPAAAVKILEEASGRLDASAWPYPVVHYLQGALTAEELLARATDNDKLTEAHAYIGLDLSLKGRSDDALPHLRWVAEHGNKNFVEYPLALSELERLGADSRNPIK
jgi:lipoprotein NlpI